MISEIRNDIICNPNPDIMEYLVMKLESRQRNLSKCASIFNTIDSYESFYQKKKDIFLLFKNLEEEIHQAAMAIRALLAQNKALSQETIDISSIQNNYNKLLKENNYLLIENNNYAKKLKEINNINKSQKRAKSPSFNTSSKNKKSCDNKNNKSQRQFKLMKKISSNKRKNNNNINKNNKLNDKEKPKKDENFDSYDYDFNDVKQLKNVKNIMEDMNNNKNKLKEVIDEHFGRNHTQENRSYNYFKNN